MRELFTLQMNHLHCEKKVNYVEKRSKTDFFAEKTKELGGCKQ